MTKRYYIYKTTCQLNGMIYIGKHATKRPIENDTYLGSGYWLNLDIELYGKENFTREILQECSSKEEMDAIEEAIVNKAFINRDDTYNATTGGKGGWGGIPVRNKLTGECHVVSEKEFLTNPDLEHTTKGTSPVIDKNGRTFRVPLDDPRYLSGELKHIMHDLVSVKDKDGVHSNVSKDDPRYLSGELVGRTTNLACVKDSDNNTFMVELDDPRYLSGELVGANIGKRVAKDSNGNFIQVSTDDPRFETGELSHHNRGKIWVTNGKESTLINEEDSKELLSKGWRLGKFKSPRIWINNNGQSKMIPATTLKDWKVKGWKKGRK